jgi:hypothetical protein
MTTARPFIVLLALTLPFLEGCGGAVVRETASPTTASTPPATPPTTSPAPANPQLMLSATTLSFGSVPVNTAATQTLTMTSSGTTAVTVNSAAITGAGFSLVGGSLPATLNPAQPLALQVQFEPTSAGAQTGQITISSNSTSGGTSVVALSGAGTAAATAGGHQVELQWDAPASSTDPVAGYNIYRATGGSAYTKINSAIDLVPDYVDTAVMSGTTYNYQVKSVDSKGVESAPSNLSTVTVP